MSPFILTLRLDAASSEHFNALRREHFPPERNHLDAHLTLFHALPAEEETRIRADLDEICAATPLPNLEYPRLRFLGKGTAVEVEAPAVVILRRELSQRWRAFLGAQDGQNIRPHVTIQNKVPPAQARALFDQLSQSWKPFEGVGEGLALWIYRGGPWESAGEWNFAAR